jgi:hypothetical protein
MTTALYETLASHKIADNKASLYVNAIEDLRECSEEFDEALNHWLEARPTNRRRVQPKVLDDCHDILARVKKAVMFLESEFSSDSEEGFVPRIRRPRIDVADMAVVNDVCSGRLKTELNISEKLIAVEILTKRGCSITKIAEMTGTTERHVGRLRKKIRENAQNG